MQNIATIKMNSLISKPGPLQCCVIICFNAVLIMNMTMGRRMVIVRRLSPKFAQHVLMSDPKYFPNLLKLNMSLVFMIVSIC